MTEWIYFVNDKSENWNYDCSSLDFFKGEHRDCDSHVWTLSRRLKQFAVGDTLWVRATLPLSAFIGKGEVVSELVESPGEGFVFDVVWDDELSALMASTPIKGILEKHTQAPRPLTTTEFAVLRKAASAIAS